MKTLELTFLLLMIATLLFCGCKKGPPMGKITGTVTYNGEPLKTGVIVFDVEGARQGRAEVENGKIVKASTYDNNDGISIGKAKISITSYEYTQTSAPPVVSRQNPNRPDTGGGLSSYSPPKITSNLPQKYANPHISGLSATIEKGENTITLELSDK